VVLHLTRDLGVNLAGVEIVLQTCGRRCRRCQRQIEEFVTSLNQEMASRDKAGQAGRKQAFPDSVCEAEISCQLSAISYQPKPVWLIADSFES